MVSFPPWELADANFSRLHHALKLLFPDLQLFLEPGHDFRPLLRVFPQVHFQRCSSKSLLAGIAGEPGKAIIDFQKLTSRDRTDSNGVRA